MERNKDWKKIAAPERRKKKEELFVVSNDFMEGNHSYIIP